MKCAPRVDPASRFRPPPFSWEDLARPLIAGLALIGAAACGGSPAAPAEEPEPLEPDPPPVLIERIARAPRSSGFGCLPPSSGLAVDGLREAGVTATVTATLRRWTIDALPRLLAAPLSGSCEALRTEAALAGASGPTPASAIRAAAGWLGASAGFEDRYRPASFLEAYEHVCGSGLCTETGTIPSALADALTPLFLRALTAARVEAIRRASRGDRSVRHWVSHGGDGLLAASAGTGFDPHYPADIGYLSASRVEVYEAAASLAEAVLAIDWSPFVGLTGVSWRLDTLWGPIIVADGADHQHAYDVAPLLLIDLGGDDDYRGAAGATSEPRPAAVVVDLQGADAHGYPELAGTATVATLPEDEDGRWTGDRFVDASISTLGRQGGARTGIALWFDLGADDDVYVALRASQGYAHQGVGLLYDAGGNDRYRVEAAGQGAAQFGIGVLMDVGRGQDVYDAEHTAQGFGYTDGVGILVDDGGDDRYVCAPEGIRFPSAQLPGIQASLCQGAGFGRRDDETPDQAMAGGLGVMVDQAGDDRYVGGVYAQGVGLAEGVGLLIDGAGRDSYDVRWHGLGAGVHGGAGVLIDRGSSPDHYGGSGAGVNVLMGVGHDRAVGVFVEQGGDDAYHLSGLSAGAATCESVGLFIDERGNDAYVGPTSQALGHAQADGCAAPGVGLMVDAGGEEQYPAGGPAGERDRWLDGSGGVGVDGEGASGASGADNSP